MLGTSVPEATIDEHRDAAAGEDEVRSAVQPRKRPEVNAVTKARRVHAASHSDLRLRVSTAIALHRLAYSRGRGPRVRQLTPPDLALVAIDAAPSALEGFEVVDERRLEIIADSERACMQTAVEPFGGSKGQGRPAVSVDEP
jgi:hypothetical protein